MQLKRLHASSYIIYLLLKGCINVIYHHRVTQDIIPGLAGAEGDDASTARKDVSMAILLYSKIFSSDFLYRS